MERRRQSSGVHTAAPGGRSNRAREDHAAFEFAQYKELEDLGRFDEAWAALERANPGHARAPETPWFRTSERLFDDGDSALRRRIHPVARAPVRRAACRSSSSACRAPARRCSSASSATIRRLRRPANCTDFARQLRWVADRHGHQPARSTRLVEAAGDIDFARSAAATLSRRAWRAGGRPYYVDKLPPNFLLAGFIRRALPQAKILHMGRDPDGPLLLEFPRAVRRCLRLQLRPRCAGRAPPRNTAG